MCATLPGHWRPRNPGPIAAGKLCTMHHLDQTLPEAYETATRTMIGHFMDPDRIAHEKASRWSGKD